MRAATPKFTPVQLHAQALSVAMRLNRAFSWVASHDVQQGAFNKSNQESYAAYQNWLQS